jgi:hypothetical protein
MLLFGGITALLCIVSLIVVAVVVVPRIIDGGEPTVAPSSTDVPTELLPPTWTPTLSPPSPISSPTPQPVIVPEPTPAAVRISIAVSTAEVRVGDVLTASVTVENGGEFPLTNLRYQLVSGWEATMEALTPPLGVREVVEPGGSASVVFELRAIQTGTASLQANVTMEVPDPPRLEGMTSEQVIVSVIQ